MAIGIEYPPKGTDAAFVGFPGLIERLDDRIVDAHRVGAGDEVTDDVGLGERARHRVLAIEPGARPTKLGDQPV